MLTGFTLVAFFAAVVFATTGFYTVALVLFRVEFAIVEFFEALV